MTLCLDAVGAASEASQLCLGVRTAMSPLVDDRNTTASSNAPSMATMDAGSAWACVPGEVFEDAGMDAGNVEVGDDELPSAGDSAGTEQRFCGRIITRADGRHRYALLERDGGRFSLNFSIDINFDLFF